MSAETAREKHIDRLVWALAILVFFFLLGTRALNEPDEGRYGEIAREMVETGDWLVPHIWYVPHLDKPPMTYWLVALSIKAFGVNEWAVRLPLALAGLSGAWAAWLFALSLGGRIVARWAVLILASSILYFAMARMLTTDIFLTQFIAWAIYFFWRSWRALDAFEADDEELRARAGKRFFGWQVALWVALSGGFLTKGPIALLIPALAAIGLVVFRRVQKVRWQLLMLGTAAGLLVFAILAAPWFLMVFETVPKSFDFMVKGQVVGHAMGGEAKNRSEPFFYFFGILALGFLPWTWLLGWLWRKSHWRQLSDRQKDGWLLLSVWAVSTFAIFSINSSKLPAYILPMFPALAVMTALRWPDWRTPEGTRPLPRWLWRLTLASPFLPMIAMPLVYRFEFQAHDEPWIWWQVGVAAGALIAFPMAGRNWTPRQCGFWATGLALAQLFLFISTVPTVETRLKSNQTLKEIALRLQQEYKPGAEIIAYHRLPQGLPLYAFPTINQTNQPLLCGMPTNRIPFEFPGNLERLGDRHLPDREAFIRKLEGTNRVLVVAWRGTLDGLKQDATNTPPPRLILKSGQYELFSNR